MKHVLVVDQDPAILKSAEDALRDIYKVTLIASEDVLTDSMKQAHPDLILISAKLLETDGHRLMDILFNSPENSAIPVIFLTNQNDRKMEQMVAAAGAVDFITKPFVPDTLVNRVNTYLELIAYRKDRSEAEKFQDAISLSFAELVEFRDETTGGHLKNTTRYFRILLEEVIKKEKYRDIIPEEEFRDLIRSVPLHDIGKIGINDEVLRKASSLNYNEYEHMKTHTTLGKEAFEKIIKETGGTRWLYLAKDIAYCHHERWDGTGYPNGLKGEEIPLYARILTIADVYDALTSRRTYKEAYSHEKAVEIIIEGKGSLFDPDLVELFVQTNESFKQALLNKYQAS